MTALKKVLLGNLIESVSKKHSFYKDEIIFLNTSDIYSGKVLNHEYSVVETLPGQAKKSIKKNDILFSEIRPANKRFAYVDFDSEDYVVSTKLMVLRPKTKEILSKYLYYLLTSSETLQYLQSVAESRSGTFPQITFSEVSQIEIDLPSIKEQEKIIEIVETLYKKIDVNNKIIETLEEVSNLLYKYWFIDYVPFSELVESEVGLIPKGWELTEIGQAVEVMGGGTPKTKVVEYWDNGDIEWFSPTDLTSSKTMFITSSSKKITALGLEKSSAKLFPPYSIMMTSRATIGEIAINRTESCTNQGFITLIPNDNFSMYQLYPWLKNNMDQIMLLANGSTFKEISKTNFKKLKIVKAKRIDEYTEKSKNIFNLIDNTLKENEYLIHTIDYILPRLLKGEIDLNEVEIKVETLI
ncbi:restriction endonuclease subunit S [Bacillus sp. AG4(2022)]|uniref:restriction endonuclease subunit S n=1 Tax=Bacillus sp. AG4(2022) TaxID=2962594 RepID=UPI0028810B2E|nr:restriction endonuclease subunit S [Bacillus sp. AG4(2022)]MDT0163526.1 restriction endonuclease subunit S [Bacillus sp. AG4(2022)]